MSYEPVFSVVMPVYDRSEEVIPSVKTVLNQSFQDFELIIVDDERSDEGLEGVVESLDDERISLYTYGKGVSEARNFGIKKSEGRFVAFLDSDDFWKPDFLERMSERLSENGIVTCFFRKVYEEKKVSEVEKPYYKGYNVLESLLRGHTIPPAAIAFSKEIFDEVGYFDEGMSIWEDSDMWIRAIESFGEPEIIEKPLAVHIRRRDSSSESMESGEVRENLRRFIENNRGLLEEKGFLEDRLEELDGL